LNRIEPRPTSIEKEIFPVMAQDNNLHAMELKGIFFFFPFIFFKTIKLN